MQFASRPQGTDWVNVLRATASGADVLVALLVAGGFALIVLGPGDRVLGLGRRVLSVLLWIGLGLAALSLVSAEELVRLAGREQSGVQYFATGTNATATLRWTSEIGLALPFVVAAAITTFVAWSALQALNDGLTDPQSDDD